MIAWNEIFSNEWLYIDSRCEYQCLGCQVQARGRDGISLRALIQKGTFFDYYPYKKIYHLVGGDPFFDPYLETVAQFLKEQKIKVWIWTPGVHIDRTIQTFSVVCLDLLL